MTHCHRLFYLILPALLALLPLVTAPASAELTGQIYELRTLEHRYAASLVVDLCDDLGKSRNRCKVQQLEPGRIVVFASADVHAEILKLLERSDPPLPASLGFRVVLVQAGSTDDASTSPLPSDVRRALDAVRELLGLEEPTAADTTLLSTSNTATSRLVGRDGTAFELSIALRSLVTRREGPEVTVEIVVSRVEERDQMLSSVVTLALGETVVAGTSRTPPNNEPLIVLFSWLSPPPTPSGA